MTNHITRCSLVLALATGAIASHTATAAAATTVKLLADGLVEVKAAPGVANWIYIRESDDRLAFFDLTDPVKNLGGCREERPNPHVVSCRTKDVKAITVLLGDRDDFFHGWSSTVALRVAGEAGSDEIHGSEHADTLEGGGGDDTLTGGYGGDRLFGDGGADILDGGPGSSQDRRDHLYGGLGVDVADYSTHQARVWLSLNNATDDGTPELAGGAGEADFIASDVEGAVGSRYHDILEGDAYANVLRGGLGNDELHGFAGWDTLIGEGGADFMVGGDHADFVDARDGTGDWLVDCGGGSDAFTADAADLRVVSCETPQ